MSSSKRKPEMHCDARCYDGARALTEMQLCILDYNTYSIRNTSTIASNTNVIIVAILSILIYKLIVTVQASTITCQSTSA